MSISFPGESVQHGPCGARPIPMVNVFRRDGKAMAAARRKLPPGGAVPEDTFEGGGGGGPTGGG